MSQHSHALTASQLHLWKSQILSPAVPMFNQVTTTIWHHGSDTKLDVKALRSAWHSIQRDHPVLRTFIGSDEEDNPTQCYLASSVDLVEVELDSLAGTPASRVQTWVTKRARRPFALDQPLIELALLHQDSTDDVLYLNMHHLIADAWSTVLVWQSLLDAYDSLRIVQVLPGQSDESAQESTAPRHFHDYVGTHPDNDANEIARRQSNGKLPATQPAPVFYDHPGKQPDTASTRVPLSLSDDEIGDFNKLVNDPALQLINRNLSEMCLHLTALVIYLHKATSADEIVIEAPILGRFDKRWMHVIGNFIEMISIVVPISDDDSVLSVFTRARDALFTAIGTAKPGCTANLSSPTVHGVLNFITSSLDAQSAGRVAIQWHHSGHSDTHHPMRLHCADWNNRGFPEMSMDLNHGFFNHTGMQRAPHHLASVYRAMSESREIRVADIHCLTPDERWRFDGQRRTAVAEYPPVLSARLTNIARAHPALPALIDENRSLSYARLETLTGNVAVNLRKLGVGKGDRVAVCMRRTLFLPVVLLGIMRSGAAYVPIDHEQPEKRVQQILLESSACCIIRNESGFVAPGDSVLTVDAAALLEALPETRAPDHLDQNAVASEAVSDICAPAGIDPAYIIFTSGSTGKPKGVVVTHNALMNYLSWADGYYRLPCPLVMPLFTSIAFDLTVTSLFLPLLSAGTVRVFTQTSDDPATLLFSVMDCQALNTVKLTPAHLTILACGDRQSTSIRQLIVGGEDLKCATALRTRSCFSRTVRIVNEYGPTEVTVGCVVRDWQENTATGSVPIGLPIDGISALVLNTAQQPQFEGMAGELYLGGHSLASGYFNNPEVTADRFIESPWHPDGPLYRTGDFVRIHNDELVYLGRSGDLLKIRGYRIELSEIENALADHPELDECAVTSNAIEHGNTAGEESSNCSVCGLSSRHPDGKLDTVGLCSLCAQYQSNQQRVSEYFKSREDLDRLVGEIKSARRGDYDAVVLLSGGKDSTFALSKLVELGLKIFAFSLDNGFISDQAKSNIDLVCKRLGVDHHYATTNHMNEIFRDSLTRYSNVCHGCFKTIYNLSLEFAAQHTIDYIFTGLSRGQLFETRLNNELFTDRTIPIAGIDDMVQQARIQYHAIKDAPHNLLNITSVNNGSLPRQIAIVDFYRYYHVKMSDMLEHLKNRAGWLRPADTGRSTNCLINDVGIHVHKLEQGYHNYSLPYSWDVRLGHKTRNDALEELDDEIDEQRVQSILDTIHYMPEPLNESRQSDQLRAYYTSSSQLQPALVMDWLKLRLPGYMLPSKLTRIQSMPLTANGKIDRKALAGINIAATLHGTDSAPNRLSETESKIATLWQQLTGVDSVNPADNFFEIGGDSLSAIRCVMALRRSGYRIEPADLFRQPVLGQFASVLAASHEPETAQVKSAPEKFASLSASQSMKLKKLLQKAPDK